MALTSLLYRRRVIEDYTPETGPFAITLSSRHLTVGAACVTIFLGRSARKDVLRIASHDSHSHSHSHPHPLFLSPFPSPFSINFNITLPRLPFTTNIHCIEGVLLQQTSFTSLNPQGPRISFPDQRFAFFTLHGRAFHLERASEGRSLAASTIARLPTHDSCWPSSFPLDLIPGPGYASYTLIFEIELVDGSQVRRKVAVKSPVVLADVSLGSHN